MARKELEGFDKESYTFKIAFFANHEDSQYGRAMSRKLVKGFSAVKKAVTQYKSICGMSEETVVYFTGEGALEGFNGEYSTPGYESLENFAFDEFWIYPDPNYRGNNNNRFYGTVRDYRESLSQ